jgi:hypothetical protein
MSSDACPSQNADHQAAGRPHDVLDILLGIDLVIDFSNTASLNAHTYVPSTNSPSNYIIHRELIPVLVRCAAGKTHRHVDSGKKETRSSYRRGDAGSRSPDENGFLLIRTRGQNACFAAQRFARAAMASAFEVEAQLAPACLFGENHRAQILPKDPHISPSRDRGAGAYRQSGAARFFLPHMGSEGGSLPSSACGHPGTTGQTIDVAAT